MHSNAHSRLVIHELLMLHLYIWSAGTKKKKRPYITPIFLSNQAFSVIKAHLKLVCLVLVLKTAKHKCMQGVYTAVYFIPREIIGTSLDICDLPLKSAFRRKMQTPNRHHPPHKHFLNPFITIWHNKKRNKHPCIYEEKNTQTKHQRKSLGKYDFVRCLVMAVASHNRM